MQKRQFKTAGCLKRRFSLTLKEQPGEIKFEYLGVFTYARSLNLIVESWWLPKTKIPCRLLYSDTEFRALR